MRALIPLFAAAILLAGCMSETTTTTTSSTTSTGPSIPAAFTMDNGAAGCYEVVGLLLVDLAQAQKSLPANWTAEDAQAALLTPQPTGKGAIWFNGYSCANSTMARAPLAAAEFGVLVKAPRLDMNVTGNASTFNVYQVLHLTDSQAQREVLASVGAASGPANVTVTQMSAGGSERGTVAVTNGSAAIYSFEFVGLLPDTFAGSADFWQQTPDGMATFHYEITSRPVLQGTATSCAFVDPAVQAVTGTADCRGTAAAVIVIPDQAWASELRWMPGVHAVA